MSDGFRIPWWAALLVLAVCVMGIAGHDLWTPDEPRDACVSYTVVSSGDWVVPRLAGQEFVEKPSLFYIVCGLMGMGLAPLLGFVGGARMTVALCALGTLVASWRLAHTLRGREVAWLTVFVLGTMGQFVVDMHWVRVDPMLSFFVVAAVACFAEVFRNGRGWAALPGGVFTAGAFLTKGPIGVVLIGAGWLALAVPYGLAARRSGVAGGAATGRAAWYFWPHLGALALAVGLSAIWVWALWARGDAAAWNAWLFDNQLGRMQGSVAALGHRKPGIFWFYPQELAVASLPWLPLLLYWIWSYGREAWRRRREWRMLIGTAPGFMALWGFGAMLLLTIPVTKRGVYLLPIYPAYAMMCADSLRGFASSGMPRWIKGWFGTWTVLVFVALAGVLLLPALPPLSEGAAWAVLANWGWRHTETLVLLVLLAVALRRRPALPNALRWFGATAILWLAVFLVPFRALDAEKSMGKSFAEFAAALPQEGREHIAAWGFDETVRAGLEFYGGVVLAPLPLENGEARLREILLGRDEEFGGAVVRLGRRDQPSWTAEAMLRHRTDVSDNRRLYYLSAPEAQ